MAKYTAGPMVAAVSGSVGGTTFSRNRAGQYTRRRAVPTNPDSVAQQNVRSILADQSRGWADRTDAERNSWEAWATQNPITDVLGQSITLSGHMAYIKLNSRLSFDGQPLLTVPPIINAPAGLLTMSFTATITGSLFDISFTTDPQPAQTRLWVTAAVVNSAGITYVRNLRRFIGTSSTAPASPFDYQADIEAVFGTLLEGQTVHMLVSTFGTVTGLLSTPLGAKQVVLA